MAMLDSISIKKKIVLGITLVSVVTLIFTCIILMSLVLKKLESNLTNDAFMMANIVAANSTGALSFTDEDSAIESLATLIHHPNVEAAVLYDEGGDKFASYLREGAIFEGKETRIVDADNVLTRETKSLNDRDYIHVEVPVISEEEVIGRIYVRFDKKSLQETTESFFYISSISALIGLAISLTMALFIQKSILQPIEKVMHALKDIAEGEGDLTQRLDDSSTDIIGELAHWFNSFVIKVHKAVVQVNEGTVKLSHSSQSLSSTMEQTSSGAMRQQKDISAIADSVHSLTSSVEEVTNDINHAADEARVVDENSISSKEVVDHTKNAIQGLSSEINEASEVINQLDQLSEKIGAVLRVIGDIADQTNLLALNAAIEAARAGEQGRGFAVVADEVRSLAGRTQSSTKEIDEIIAELKTKVRDAVDVMDKGKEQANSCVTLAEEASTSIASISEAISSIRQLTEGIFQTSMGQSQMAESIQGNIKNISQVANQTSSDAQEMYEGSVELNSLASGLEEIVNRFKV
ncbi:MAG: hypothetical protein COB51_08320 [Moraxellaceae bacterium]|nr:MAG: hypothetical protein COB51_08320 [Moraxellaceae bacterium]